MSSASFRDEEWLSCDQDGRETEAKKRIEWPEEGGESETEKRIGDIVLLAALCQSMSYEDDGDFKPIKGKPLLPEQKRRTTLLLHRLGVALTYELETDLPRNKWIWVLIILATLTIQIIPLTSANTCEYEATCQGAAACVRTVSATDYHHGSMYWLYFGCTLVGACGLAASLDHN